PAAAPPGGLPDRAGRPAGPLRPQVVVHDHAVAERLQPHLHAAGQRAADVPPHSRLAPVGEVRQRQVRPPGAPTGRVVQRGRHRPRLGDHEALVDDVHLRHGGQTTAPGCRPAFYPPGTTLHRGGHGYARFHVTAPLPAGSNAPERGPQVREYTVAPTVTVADEASVTDSLRDHAANTPDLVLFSRRVGGAWSDVTAAQFARQVAEVAKGPVAA